MNTSSKKRLSINTKRKLFTCSYCSNTFNEIWVNRTQTIYCCNFCWGNNPIVARATNGRIFKSNIKRHTIL